MTQGQGQSTAAAMLEKIFELLRTRRARAPRPLRGRPVSVGQGIPPVRSVEELARVDLSAQLPPGVDPAQWLADFLNRSAKTIRAAGGQAPAFPDPLGPDSSTPPMLQTPAQAPAMAKVDARPPLGDGVDVLAAAKAPPHDVDPLGKPTDDATKGQDEADAAELEIPPRADMPDGLAIEPPTTPAAPSIAPMAIPADYIVDGNKMVPSPAMDDTPVLDTGSGPDLAQGKTSPTPAPETPPPSGESLAGGRLDVLEAVVTDITEALNRLIDLESLGDNLGGAGLSAGQNDVDVDGLADGPTRRAEDMDALLRRKPVLLGGGDDAFWVALTSASLLTDYIWEYDFVEVELTRAGWQVLAGGRSGTCMNTYETGNTATPADLLGVGVDPDHLDTDWYTYDLKNVRINRAFRCVEGSDSQGKFYWISEPNGIDGVCV